MSVRLPFDVGRTDFIFVWIVGLVEPLATCRLFNAVPTAPGLPRGKQTLPGPTFPMGRPAASVKAAPTTPGSSEERWRSEGNCSSIVVGAVCITSSLTSTREIHAANSADSSVGECLAGIILHHHRRPTACPEGSFSAPGLRPASLQGGPPGRAPPPPGCVIKLLARGGFRAY